MKQQLLAALLILGFNIIYSQGVISDKISGKPFMLYPYEHIRGKAFLFDEWKLSNVTANDGNTFLNVLVKFDVFANKFYYSHGDTTYEFVTKINEIEMFPNAGDTSVKLVFKNGFMVPDKLTAEKFVLVYTEGKISSIKHLKKAKEEIFEYNTGKVTQFSDNSAYYFIMAGKTINEKPSAKLLRELVNDKWELVEAHITKQSLNTKKEEDFFKAIRYYNSL